MSTSDRLEKLEKAAGMEGAQHEFIYFQDLTAGARPRSDTEITGTLDGRQKMTLAEWKKIRTAHDATREIRFVDGHPAEGEEL